MTSSAVTSVADATVTVADVEIEAAVMAAEMIVVRAPNVPDKTATFRLRHRHLLHSSPSQSLSKRLLFMPRPSP